jgi:ribonuclease P protein component
MNGKPATDDQRFPKSVRLLRQADFQRVHGSHLFAADRHLVVKGARNGLAKTRLGLSISRRVGNAVVRNRWKRVIREAFRRQRGQLPGGWDLVVRPRKGAIPHAGNVARSLVSLVRRLESPRRRSSRP